MLRCLGIDDEPIALAVLSRYCDMYGGIMLETYTSPVEGIQRIKAWKPDIVLLDIEMNGASGLELARDLPPECQLIFTTAYANYALDGFNEGAVDFLHKPFFFERFSRAIQKAEQRLLMNDLLRASISDKRQIVLKSDYRSVPVSVDTIVYIESIGNYVKLHLTNGTSLMSKITLSSVLNMLPQGEFLRIHRSFVVAQCRIVKFSHSAVDVGEKSLPLGKKYAETVISLLQQRS
ncbi:MAG: LytR/AlgR family response regulator transcription factor [Muribaculaceae bacterium]